MKDIIQIRTDGKGLSVVSARELYASLGFDSSNWAKWAKKNIENNTFAIKYIDWEGFVQSTNGNQTTDYAITVDFAERLSMLARTDKGEEVRRWFQEMRNKAIALAKQPAPAAVPATQDELILMLAQRNVDTTKRLSAVEQRIDRIEAIHSEAKAELLALPEPTEDMPELATADRIRRMVNTYATAKVTPAQDVWRMLYTEMYYRYRVGVNHMKLRPGETKLQALVRVGHIDKLNTIALHVLRAQA